mgnify:FL=1
MSTSSHGRDLSARLPEAAHRPKRILLTGATGFIGQRLQAALLGSDRQVSAVVRPASAGSPSLDAACQIILADLSDVDALASACVEADAVVYCAGTVRGRELDDFRAANIDGVAAATEALNRASANTPFLLISSLAAAAPELSDYARSKYLGEEVLKENSRFPWSILRPPAVYGPGDTEMRPILEAARKGLVIRPGPPDQRLSLLHADDLAAAVLAWFEAWPACAGRTFSLDDGRPGGYDWPAFAAAAGGTGSRIVGVPRWLLNSVAETNLLVSRRVGYAPMLTPGKTRELTRTQWLCDNAAFSEATGWMPATLLEDGVRSLFDD